ncbi:MAG: tetratricopeptide repeat protein [Candidatus Obscuribacterales bacterium]|nr:tetratricopeptide repeat protein [Candidatus Obscuribacterales bacterium]
MPDSDSTLNREKVLKEAKLALKTGLSAYENDNFKLAEPLFIKALDKFEGIGETEDPDFFQCLVSLADTLYQQKRFFEAKAYYERLSVGRLKAQGSSDAQVVVALLKLAATHEKLQELHEALSTFELTLELAENTIPQGHALFGVIFDSFEILIDRHVQDPEEKKNYLDMLKSKRESFGFSESMSGVYRSLPTEDEAQSQVERLMAQTPEDIRKNLSPWTHTEISSWANEVRAQRARSTMQGLAAMAASSEEPLTRSDDVWAGKSDEIAEPSYVRDEKHKALRLSADMFRPKRNDRNELVQGEAAQFRTGGEAENQRTTMSGAPVEAVERSRLKSIDTDRRRPNILPVLSVVAVVLLIVGAIFLTHEFTKNVVAQSAGASRGSVIDLSGKIFTSSDRRRQARFVTRSSVELIDRGHSTMATYQLKGAPSQSFLGLSGLFPSSDFKLLLQEVPGGFLLPGGTKLIADESDDQKVVTKMQLLANFANYYYGNKHSYPSLEEDFVIDTNRFSLENPLTPGLNTPVLEKKVSTANTFEADFSNLLSSMRDKKPLFTADDAEKTPPGLIECYSLVSDGTVDGGAFLIRAYDSAGKLITASDPDKAFVIVLKQGVTIDPLKASRSADNQPPLFPQGKPVLVELMLQAGADSQKETESKSLETNSAGALSVEGKPGDTSSSTNSTNSQ